jgi:hypothetical protein
MATQSAPSTANRSRLPPPATTVQPATLSVVPSELGWARFRAKAQFVPTRKGAPRNSAAP